MAEGWERGDLLGVDFPIHLDALRAAGPELLTAAFRAAGTLGPGERVAAITRLEEFRGGSTGRKAELDVTYAAARTDLPERLFVKFSRDLDDELRDRGKRQMEAEVRFGLLSQLPDFPVAVPGCRFGEYHLASGSGILVTERIAFGVDGVEPHHAKARDWEVDDQLAHYGALVDALGRLAGAHRAGRFPEAAMAPFAPRPPKPTTGGDRRPSTTPEEARERIERYLRFVRRAPQLLPPSIRSEVFLAELLEQVPRSVEHAAALRAAHRADEAAHLAFCHWNANIDNAWFWRGEDGQLACGLMDWGNVGQIDVVTALASALTFAEPDLVVAHLDHLLGRFAAVFEEAGGGPVDPAGLRRRFDLQMVSGGLAWPMGAVALLERLVPDLEDCADRFDPRIVDHELPRTQLHLLTAYLSLWQAADPGKVIDRAVDRAGSGSAPTAPA